MSVKSVDKAVSLLELFSRQEPWLGITRMADSLGMSKSAAHDLAGTLVKRGLLKQDPITRQYCLGLKLFEISMIQPDVVGIHQKASGPARSLARNTGITCHLSLWDGDSVQLVHSSSFPGAKIVVFGLLGPRLPAHASALGKAVLAALERDALDEYLRTAHLSPQTPHTITDADCLLKDLESARARGYALDNQEMVVGGASLAAPFFDRSSRVLGAVSLFSTPERLVESDGFDGLSRMVLETSFEISSLYGCAPDKMSLSGRAGEF